MSSSPSVPPEVVSHIAKLAALSLSPEEIAAFATDLEKIVRYVGELGSVDTEGVVPMSHGADRTLISSALRTDELVPGLSHEDALRAAPEVADEGFVVPTFVEG